jgi:hypothetical protein
LAASIQQHPGAPAPVPDLSQDAGERLVRLVPPTIPWANYRATFNTLPFRSNQKYRTWIDGLSDASRDDLIPHEDRT